MHYSINENIVEIYIDNNTILIDAEDLDKTLSLTNLYLTKDSYVVSFIQNKVIYLHRYLTNARKEFDIDHLNHNRLDNRKSNLKEKTHAENCRNRKGPTKHNTSGYRNVHKEANNKWKVCVIKDKKQYRKRGFKTPEEANKYAIKLRMELGME
jgi:hypothetical protein